MRNNLSIERSMSNGRERSCGSLKRGRIDPILDKFDFPCFIAFLIKLAPKIYPDITDN